MIVILAPEAEADLERIGDHIAEANPQRALGFVREIRECCDQLSEMPERFPLVPRFAGAGIRRRVHGNYLIFYRSGAGQIDVLHILYGAMDFEPLLFPEG